MDRRESTADVATLCRIDERQRDPGEDLAAGQHFHLHLRAAMTNVILWPDGFFDRRVFGREIEDRVVLQSRVSNAQYVFEQQLRSGCHQSVDGRRAAGVHAAAVGHKLAKDGGLLGRHLHDPGQDHGPVAAQLVQADIRHHSERNVRLLQDPRDAHGRYPVWA
ncbi:MAG: hypothetical protein ACYC3X_04740 [Pirellulaceae bacterium]